MRSNPKIIDSERIDWYEQESTRLNYQMIFEEKGASEHSEEVDKKIKAKVQKLLDKRDQKWKAKLGKAREEAFARGFDEGKQEGVELANAEIDHKVSVLEQALEQGHEEWRQRQQLLDPGLLDLVFDITESILGIPVENPDIRKNVEIELGKLLQKIDEQSKPLLWVSESDFDYIKKLKEEYAPKTTVNIQVSKEYNPGEFELETNRETVIHSFREMLNDFKETLSLPSWK